MFLQSLLFLSLCPSVQLPEHLVVYDLGTPGGGESEAAAIDRDGIVGTAVDRQGIPVAFHSDRLGNRRTLKGLGGPSTGASSICWNAIGGWSELLNGDIHAAYWPDPMLPIAAIDLGTLGGRNSFIKDVRGPHGESSAVGGSDLANGEHHAFLWLKRYGILHDLGTLGGGYSRAYAAAYHRAAGEAETLAGDRHAALYSWDWVGNPLPVVDLGTLGGTFSTARVITTAGDIAGWSTLVNGDQHAFLYEDSTGTMIDLGTLGGRNSWARGAGGNAVYGSSQTSSGAIHAFVWEGGVMTDLNDLLPAGSGWVLESAVGQDLFGFSWTVTGTGWYQGSRRAFKAMGLDLHTYQWGDHVKMTVSPVDSGIQVVFAAGLNTGSTIVPGCGGLTLGLDQAREIGRSVGASQSVVLELQNPPILAGTTVFLQALVPSTCSVTDVVEVVLQ